MLTFQDFESSNYFVSNFFGKPSFVHSCIVDRVKYKINRQNGVSKKKWTDQLFEYETTSVRSSLKNNR